MMEVEICFNYVEKVFDVKLGMYRIIYQSTTQLPEYATEWLKKWDSQINEKKEEQMTELTFLLDLLLNHKLPKTTQLAIKDRIGDIDNSRQAPALERKPNSSLLPVKPVEVVAHTQAAAQALLAREGLIANAGNEKPEPGRTSPRKF